MVWTRFMWLISKRFRFHFAEFNGRATIVQLRRRREPIIEDWIVISGETKTKSSLIDRSKIIRLTEGERHVSTFEFVVLSLITYEYNQSVSFWVKTNHYIIIDLLLCSKRKRAQQGNFLYSFIIVQIIES